MIAIILAAGDSIFWKWNTRKHLFSLGKEKIIGRLQRQLEDRKIDYIVVTEDIDIMAESKNVVIPKSFYSTIDTIESVAKAWENHDRIIILLGDTIYSKESIDTITTCAEDLRFFGKESKLPNDQEIFAVSTNRAKEIHQLPTDGGLLEYYQLTESKPMYILDDYTTDINTYEEYREFVSNVVNAGKLDDTLK